MQGKDPFLALLGLFILSTTFFFCGKAQVTSPPPAALESRTTIPPPAPNISEPLPLSLSVPSVSVPMGLSGRSDAQVTDHTAMYRINSAPLLAEEDTPLNRVAAILYGDPIEVLEVGGQTGNQGLGYGHGVLSEELTEADVEGLPPQGMAVDQMTPNGFRISRLVAWRPTDERRWQQRRLEWFIGTERGQP